MKFLKCDACDSIMVKALCGGACSGDGLAVIEPNTVDASREKHVPVIEREGNKVTVKVGSAVHPMSEEHYIQFIAVETENGFAVRRLKPTDAPEAFFCLDKTDVPVAVYAYCNLHGLWKVEF